MNELTMIDVVLTCETEFCENQNIPITTQMAEGGMAMCGCCGVEITNIVILTP
jgi:hypothetical protein